MVSCPHLCGMIALGLQQTQLTGAGDRFGSPLDLQLVKDDPCVSLDRAQGEEERSATGGRRTVTVRTVCVENLDDTRVHAGLMPYKHCREGKQACASSES